MTMDKVDYRDMLLHPVEAFELVKDKIQKLRGKNESEAVKWEFVLREIAIIMNISALDKGVLTKDEHTELLDQQMSVLETHEIDGYTLAVSVARPSRELMHKWIVEELDEIHNSAAGYTGNTTQKWTAFEHLWSWMFGIKVAGE